MLHCTNCGHANTAQSNFCSNCGSKLDRLSGETTSVIALDFDGVFFKDLTPEEEEAVRSLRPGSALLLVKGNYSSERFLIDVAQVIAGRHPDAEIFLDDITVSRHHAEFFYDGPSLRLQDLGSLNGTYVNRQLIEGPVTLKTGDEVQIGKFRMVCYVSAGSH